MKEDKKLYEVFISGIQNHEYYKKKHKRETKNLLFNELMYFLWILYIMVMSPFAKITDKKIFMVYADIHEKILKSDKGSKNLIYMGRILRKPILVYNRNSVFSIFNKTDRIKVFLKSMSWLLKNNIRLLYFAHALDFYTIYLFIKEQNANEIVISGHFDRYATWISLICKKENILFTIEQHGALEKIDLPHKIFANTIVCFNKNEEEYFRKIIFNERECKFIHKGFKSNVHFCKYKKKEKYLLGIASQDLYTKETIKVIRYLNKNYNNDIKILIYPHPREAKSIFNAEIRKNKNIEIVAEHRYSNIDMLFTFFSTLAYDYMQFENVKIICYPFDGIEMSFFNDERIIVIKKIEEIKKFIK